MFTLYDLLRTWENISCDSTPEIKCYKNTKYKKCDYIGSIKIKVSDLLRDGNPYNDLTKQRVIGFRKSVNGIRIEIMEDIG